MCGINVVGGGGGGHVLLRKPSNLHAPDVFSHQEMLPGLPDSESANGTHNPLRTSC